MEKTIKNLLIAQEYSDAAKDRDMLSDSDLHYKQIKNIINTFSDYYRITDKLYLKKSIYLKKAMQSAKKENISVYYDYNECCLYFEMPFGQCSFHLFDDQYIVKNVIVLENYKWSGLTNTGKLLRNNYKG